MRVWLAPSAFFPSVGGVEELTLKLAQHLQGRGHDVLVLTHRWPRELAVTQQVEGVEVLRLPFEIPTRNPRTWAGARRAAREVATRLDDLTAPDVVHVQCPAGQTPHVARFTRAKGVPVVLSTQGETYMDAGALYAHSAVARRNLRRAAASAACLTACSDHAARGASRIAARFSRASIIPNGIDSADWAGLPTTRAPVLAAWGRHVPQKGFDLLLEAFSLVRRDEPEATLLLGGSGPETGRLEALATDGVQLLGPLDRAGVRALLARASVVAVPSRVEPFGIVALEALAAGRGLVYSSHGGLGEAAGGCGRAADPFDPVAFASALVSELRDPTPAPAAQARARELSWEHVVDQYESVYVRATAPATSHDR